MQRTSRNSSQVMNTSALFGPGAETLWKKNTRKRRKSGLTSTTHLPPNIAAELGQAEMLYVNGEVQQAIDLLSSVSRQAPRLAEPYNILGLIYEESGDYLRALQLFVLAASFTPKSIELWKKVAQYAGLIGEYDQAIAACIRCYKLEPVHDHLAKRVLFLIRSRQMKKAREILRVYLSKYPEQMSFLIDFGDEAEKVGVSETAISAYLRFIFHYLGTSSTDNELLQSLLRFSCEKKSVEVIINNLDNIFYAVRRTVDILLQKSDGLQPSIDLIDVSLNALQYAIDHLPYGVGEVPQFPMDLSLLMGVCKLRMQDESQLEVGLTILNPILKILEDNDLNSEGETEAPNTSNLMIDRPNDNGSGSEIEDNTIETLMRPKANDLLDVVTKALSDLSLFFMRQRIRIAEEFVSLGMLTRADKILSALFTHLKNVDMFLIRVDIEQKQSGIIANYLKDEAAMKTMGVMWKDIGNVYCQLNKEENAYSSFGNALDHNESDIEALSKYAELTRIHFAGNSEQLLTMLSNHFEKVIEEFEAFQSKTIATSSSVVSRKRSRASLATSASQKSVHFQDSEHLNVESMPMDITAESSLPCDADGDSGLVMTNSSSSIDNDMQIPLDVTLDSEYDEVDDLADDLYDAEASTTADNSEAQSEANIFIEDEDETEETDGNENTNNKNHSKDKFYSRSELQHEIFALIEWSHLLIDIAQDGALTYCSLTVPLLEHWCFSTSTSSGVMDGLSVLSRKKQRKPIISMHDLINTDSSLNYRSKPWLNEEQNVYGKLINGWCDYVNIEKLLGKDLLMDLANKTTPILIQIDEVLETSMKGPLAESANELQRACTLMHLRKHGAKRVRPGAADVSTEVDMLSEDESDSDVEDDSTKTGSGSQRKLSTKKRKLSTLRRFGRPKKVFVRMTGVNGGLMFNDFRSAANLERDEPFMAAANNYSEVVRQAANQLLSNPNDIVTANILFRQLIAESPKFESPLVSKFIESILPVNRLLAVDSNNVVSTLLTGHEFAKAKKNNDALEKYLNAFCCGATQPLVALCLASFLISLSNHSHIKHRQETLMKGIVLLQRYSDIRMNQNLPNGDSQYGEMLSETSLLQETHYNLGRALQELQLYHLAVGQYTKALELVGKNSDLKGKNLNVTRETAHNLVLIYKRSESFDLALEVMSNYLSFD